MVDTSKFGTTAAKGTAVIKRKDGSKVFISSSGKVVSQTIRKDGKDIPSFNIVFKSGTGGRAAGTSKVVTSLKQLNVAQQVNRIQENVNLQQAGQQQRVRIQGVVDRSGRLVNVRAINSMRTPSFFERTQKTGSIGIARRTGSSGLILREQLRGVRQGQAISELPPSVFKEEFQKIRKQAIKEGLKSKLRTNEQKQALNRIRIIDNKINEFNSNHNQAINSLFNSLGVKGTSKSNSIIKASAFLTKWFNPIIVGFEVGALIKQFRIAQKGGIINVRKFIFSLPKKTIDGLRALPKGLNNYINNFDKFNKIALEHTKKFFNKFLNPKSVSGKANIIVVLAILGLPLISVFRGGLRIAQKGISNLIKKFNSLSSFKRIKVFEVIKKNKDINKIIKEAKLNLFKLQKEIGKKVLTSDVRSQKVISKLKSTRISKNKSIIKDGVDRLNDQIKTLNKVQKKIKLVDEFVITNEIAQAEINVAKRILRDLIRQRSFLSSVSGVTFNGLNQILISSNAFFRSFIIFNKSILKSKAGKASLLSVRNVLNKAKSNRALFKQVQKSFIKELKKKNLRLSDEKLLRALAKRFDNALKRKKKVSKKSLVTKKLSDKQKEVLAKNKRVGSVFKARDGKTYKVISLESDISVGGGQVQILVLKTLQEVKTKQTQKVVSVQKQTQNQARAQLQKVLTKQKIKRFSVTKKVQVLKNKLKVRWKVIPLLRSKQAVKQKVAKRIKQKVRVVKVKRLKLKKPIRKIKKVKRVKKPVKKIKRIRTIRKVKKVRRVAALIKRRKKSRVLKKKIRKILFKIPSKFKPSLVAVIENITSTKKPELITGAEIRPIIVKLIRNKRKRSKK